METHEVEKNSNLESIGAILIAVVALIAAVVAWRSSVVDDAAGDADFGGLRAAINATETTAINNVNAYESYGGYVAYWLNSQLADLIGQDLETASEEETPVLTAELKKANDLSDANRDMFESRYLNRDGTYSVQRQLGELWADASREKDMEYEKQFQEADQLRTKSIRMLIALLILTIAPVFFSLVETVSGKMRYAMLALGSLFMVAGTVFAVLIELSKV